MASQGLGKPWSIGALLRGERPLAVVVLNWELPDDETLLTLWSHAVVRVCADGGTNRLADASDRIEGGLQPPEIVVGDFDSLRPAVRARYEAQVRAASFLSTCSPISRTRPMCRARFFCTSLTRTQPTWPKRGRICPPPPLSWTW